MFFKAENDVCCKYSLCTSINIYEQRGIFTLFHFYFYKRIKPLWPFKNKNLSCKLFASRLPFPDRAVFVFRSMTGILRSAASSLHRECVARCSQVSELQEANKKSSRSRDAQTNGTGTSSKNSLRYYWKYLQAVDTTENLSPHWATQNTNQSIKGPVCKIGLDLWVLYWWKQKTCWPRSALIKGYAGSTMKAILFSSP